MLWDIPTRGWLGDLASPLLYTMLFLPKFPRMTGLLGHWKIARLGAASGCSPVPDASSSFPKAVEIVATG